MNGPTAWAVIIAALALCVSSFMAWRAWMTRRDYARGVIIAKRIEAATDFMKEFDSVQAGIVRIFSAINVVEQSQLPPAKAYEATSSVNTDGLNAATSRITILFDQETARVANEVYLEMVSLVRLALDAVPAAGPKRMEFREKMTPTLIAQKARWREIVRPAITRKTDAFFPGE